MDAGDIILTGLVAGILIFVMASLFFVQPVVQADIVTVSVNGTADVFVQDQISRILDLKFGRLQTLSSLTVQANPEDVNLTIANTTGFVDGITVGIFSATEPDVFYLGRQIGPPVGNVITLDTPIDRIFPINSPISSADTNMAVDGSVTTQKFQIGPVGPNSTTIVDITRVMGIILDNSAMDDGLFGGIPALTNGVVLRHNNHVIDNIWNIKTNGDIALLTFDAAYTTKSPSGQYGYRFRNSFGGQDKHGVVIELDVGDILEILIQDDLTGLVQFEMLAQGHFKD